MSDKVSVVHEPSLGAREVPSLNQVQIQMKEVGVAGQYKLLVGQGKRFSLLEGSDKGLEKGLDGGSVSLKTKLRKGNGGVVLAKEQVKVAFSKKRIASGDRGSCTNKECVRFSVWEEACSFNMIAVLRPCGSLDGSVGTSSSLPRMVSKLDFKKRDRLVSSGKKDNH
ncbi:hypothetical protein QYF36_022935 [Acer negundo]|nr:hypothetical protein QYF36_022935 [Acer negundo]